MNTLTIQRLPQTTALMGVILSLLLLLTGLPAAAERTVTYFHSDAAGSVVAASNAAGDLLWRKHYAPYGQQLSGSDTTEPTAYAGHVHDQDIGLTYMKARYYDPQAGRFLGVDPAGVSESNPLSFNRYAYANNNPYKYVDPDGRVGKLINGGIKLIKHGGNPKKAGKEFIADVADSVTTLVDPSASAVDKGLAAFDLVSPVGTQDIKKLADATKGGDDLVRVRHHTSPEGARGIEKDGAINPGRGDPVGVHVETAPFGPSKSASAETGAFGRGRFVEFDVPRSSIQPTKVGPRNTGVIPTDKPLDVKSANPKVRHQ